jgi:hypothetical protein
VGAAHPAGSVREQQGATAEAFRAGRSTADGGTGGVRSAPDLLTSRTGEPAGTPSGRPTHIDPEDDAETRRSLELENSGAAVIADRGYEIRQNPTKGEVAQARHDTGDVGNPRKDPDYLLEGRVFDCYSPIKPDKAVRGIWAEAKRKVDVGQTQRVVVNLEDWRGDMSALRKQFADWPIEGLKELKVITRDGDVVQVDLPPYQPREVNPWRLNTD